jgi:hypothetical protein
MLSVPASQALTPATHKAATGAGSTNKLHLTLCMQIACLAAVHAVKEAIETEPDVVFTQAPIAIALAQAAFLLEFALHAAKWLGHRQNFRGVPHELSGDCGWKTYFRNAD